MERGLWQIKLEPMNMGKYLYIRLMMGRQIQKLYSYLSIGCDKEKISVSSFSNLSAKGYVVDGENQIPVINVKDGNLVTAINNFVANHIQIPKFIFEERKKVDEKFYEVNKSKYPEHLEKLVRIKSGNPR